jgi:Ni/Co efflux regulator RcnB
MVMINKTVLICAALAWTCATTMTFAQEHGKQAGVHKFHRQAHTHRHSPAHHKAMASGHASIKSHPSYGKHHHYHQRGNQLK